MAANNTKAFDGDFRLDHSGLYHI